MSLTAITTFVVIRKKPKDSKPFGETEFRFQNGKCNPDKLDESQIKVVFPSQNPVENNKEFIYKFLNFIYQGAAKNKSGDNLEAALILANNQVSMSFAQKVITEKYSVEVFVSKVDPVTMNPQEIYGNNFLTRDNWLAASLSYDAETIEVLLSSSIDAVGTTAPNRRLTTSIVGALPVTGDIQNR